MGVLVKNANVKNNYFSVIFSEGVVLEESKPKEHIIEETKRDPKKSYAFQPESEPGNPRGVSHAEGDDFFKGPETLEPQSRPADRNPS